MPSDTRPSGGELESPARIVRGTRGARMTNSLGQFELAAYSVLEGSEAGEHLVLYKGVSSGHANDAIPVRIHSACFAGDILGCDRCDCRWQLRHAMAFIAKEGSGILVYSLGEDGRAAGVVAKTESYLIMDAEHVSTVEAFRRLGIAPDRRSFAGAIAILQDFGITRVRLITNSPAKVHALKHAGFEVCEVIPSVMPANARHLATYLASKREEMGHFIPEEFDETVR